VAGRLHLWLDMKILVLAVLLVLPSFASAIEQLPGSRRKFATPKQGASEGALPGSRRKFAPVRPGAFEGALPGSRRIKPVKQGRVIVSK